MYKASNKLLKEIEDMFTIKTSMNFKEINRVTYLEDKCIQLENQITTLKGNSPLYELIGKIPKNREEEAVTRIDLIIKSWVWRG